MAFETSEIPQFELPFCKQSCLKPFLWQVINNWCFAQPCSRWISTRLLHSWYCAFSGILLPYYKTAVRSPEDGVSPRSYRFLSPRFYSIKGRDGRWQKTYFSCICDKYIQYLLLLCGTNIQEWRARENIFNYTFILFPFFFSHAMSQKLKHLVVFCKANTEPIIGHNCWHFINLKNICLGWM